MYKYFTRPEARPSDGQTNDSIESDGMSDPSRGTWALGIDNVTRFVLFAHDCTFSVTCISTPCGTRELALLVGNGPALPGMASTIASKRIQWRILMSRDLAQTELHLFDLTTYILIHSPTTYSE